MRQMYVPSELYSLPRFVNSLDILLQQHKQTRRWAGSVDEGQCGSFLPLTRGIPYLGQECLSGHLNDGQTDQDEWSSLLPKKSSIRQPETLILTSGLPWICLWNKSVWIWPADLLCPIAAVQQAHRNYQNNDQSLGHSLLSTYDMLAWLNALNKY